MKISDPKLMNLNNQSSPSVKDDVLHIQSASKLSPEEIAKAVEHHNRRHKTEKVQKVAANTQFGKSH